MIPAFDDEHDQGFELNQYFISYTSNRYKVKWNHNGEHKEDFFKFQDVSGIRKNKSAACLDGDLFWTGMIMWKYCGTTFIKSWDEQMVQLTKKYKD